MIDQIFSLSSEQAQRALLYFYDILPNEVWEGEKPSKGDIEALAEEILEVLPVDLQTHLTEVMQKDTHRGEVAKFLLQNFAQHYQLKPYVEQALKQAQEPHMAPLPYIIGALIIVLALIPKEIKKGDLYIKFGHLEDAAEFVKSIKFGYLEDIAELVKNLKNFIKK